MITSLSRWFDRNVLELGREMRLSYLPPLMVYVAAHGIAVDGEAFLESSRDELVGLGGRLERL